MGDTLDGQRSRQVALGGYVQQQQQQQQQQFASDSCAFQTCGQQCCVLERCTKQYLNSSGELSVTCFCALAYRIRLKVNFEVVLGPGLLSLLSGPSPPKSLKPHLVEE